MTKSRSNPSTRDWMLAILRQRVEEQQARWQEQGIPGLVYSWQAADLFIDQGQRAIVDLETYQHPQVKRVEIETILEPEMPPAPLSQEARTALIAREQELLHDLGF